jgi:hypothetical protein
MNTRAAMMMISMMLNKCLVCDRRSGCGVCHVDFAAHKITYYCPHCKKRYKVTQNLDYIWEVYERKPKLKTLYGLQSGEQGKTQRPEGSIGFVSPSGGGLTVTPSTPTMTEKQISQVMRVSERTMERATKVAKSDLPQSLKDVVLEHGKSVDPRYRYCQRRK